MQPSRFLPDSPAHGPVQREAERLLGRLEGRLAGSPALAARWQSLMTLYEAAALASLEDQPCTIDSAVRGIDERLRDGAPRHTWPAIDYHAASSHLAALPLDPSLPEIERFAERLTRQSRGEGGEPPRLDGIAWAGFMADLYRLAREPGAAPDLRLLGQAFAALLLRRPFGQSLGESPFARRIALGLLPWIARRLKIAGMPLLLSHGFARNRGGLEPERFPHLWAMACVEGLTLGASMLTRLERLAETLARKKIVERERRSGQAALLDFFAAHPIFTGPVFAAGLGVSAPAALATLAKLREARLLHATPGRNRVKQYQVMILLE